MKPEFDFPTVDINPQAGSSLETTIKHLVAHLSLAHQIAPDKSAEIVEQAVHREALGSTAFGRGVAIPHVTSDAVEEVTGVIGRSEAGINWPGAVDGFPVRLVFLAIVPLHCRDRWVDVLAMLASRLNNMLGDGDAA